MILKVKMTKSGYPFLQEKWIRINIDLCNYPEIRNLQISGYGITKIEVD